MRTEQEINDEMDKIQAILTNDIISPEARALYQAEYDILKWVLESSRNAPPAVSPTSLGGQQTECPMCGSNELEWKSSTHLTCKECDTDWIERSLI